MKRHRYTCRLLSDVVISSVTATEGFHESLDYLPGAKFLGIAAKQLYDERDPATLDLFHNGKVRFGDAYPLIGGEAALPVPFSWFYNKGGGLTDKTLFLHHNLTQADQKTLTGKGYQLKQARKGYFTLRSRQVLNIEQDFAIRSAYDRAQLRAKDSQMFGYFALPAGTRWTFTVEDDTEQYGTRMREALMGKRRIGRSRSAEYGLVEIAYQAEETLPPATNLAGDTTLVYAHSNLCFFDAFGRPTLRPTAQDLGFPSGATIDWEKSQVRSRLYQNWNRHRHNRDADRMIILKGSVLVVQHQATVSSEVFAQGIGDFRSEGFGQVRLNPDFLQAAGYELRLGLQKVDAHIWQPKTTGYAQEKSPQDEVVLSFLRQRKQRDENRFNLDRQINAFLSQYQGVFRGVSASQWGTVRAYAKHAVNWFTLAHLLFDQSVGALYRGQSERHWRQQGRRVKLQEFLEEIPEHDRLAATLKLAAEMAKRSRAKETAQTTTT